MHVNVTHAHDRLHNSPPRPRAIRSMNHEMELHTSIERRGPMCGARVTRAHAIGESQESSHAPPSIAPSSGGMGGVVLRGRGTAGQGGVGNYNFYCSR